jgi:FixJ family two-component response regulator
MPDQRETIVVVEDDAGMIKAIERLLRAGGFQPVCFASAEALLGTNAVSDAACLVVDIHLPGLSGFELHRRLAALGHKVPVIFITAQDETPTRDEAKALGCITYLRKPFDGQAMLAAIRLGLRRIP